MVSNSTIRPNRKESELELRHELQTLRGSAGVQRVLDLLELDRASTLRSWRTAVGEDLIRWQERYNYIEALIERIALPPKTFK